MNNPYVSPLKLAIERTYDCFSNYEISTQLEVCHCPVCMTEETRLAIIACRVRDVPVELILEYSNSAHGVPQNTGDLKAILPRYLDLIAQDEMVDHNGVGTELLRFGDAWRADPDLFSDIESEVYCECLLVLIQFYLWEDAHDGDKIWTAIAMIDTALAGGMPVQTLAVWLENCFANVDDGAKLFGEFCLSLQRIVKWKKLPKVELDLFGSGYTDATVAAGLANWLNGNSFGQMLVNADLSKMNPEQRLAVETVLSIHGQFSEKIFPLHRQYR